VRVVTRRESAVVHEPTEPRVRSSAGRGVHGILRLGESVDPGFTAR
jgi:hypothetical protein